MNSLGICYKMKLNNTMEKTPEPYLPISPPTPTKPVDWSVELVDYPCFVQPKMNGVKALLSPDGRVYLKSAERRPHLEQYGQCGHWVDGELWHPDLDLHTIIGLVNRRVADKDTAKLQFWAVDYIHPEVEQCVRIAVLEELVKSLSNAHMIVTNYCHTGLDSAEYYQQWRDIPVYDGMIYRDYKATYKFGKTQYVLKRKRELDAEYKCIGVTEGMGKFFGMLGSFQLADTKGNEFSCGGGDLTVFDRKSYWKNPPINKIIQVRFPYYSRDGIPQCPQFVRVRDNPAV